MPVPMKNKNALNKYIDRIIEKSKGSHAQGFNHILPILIECVIAHIEKKLEYPSEVYKKIETIDTDDNRGNVCWILYGENYYYFTYNREEFPNQILLREYNNRGYPKCTFDNDDTKSTVKDKIIKHII